MRVLLIARLSETSPELGKLRILAGLGVEPTVLVPDLRNSSESSRFISEGGVRMVPVPARGEHADPASRSWSQRAIRRAIRETRPELLHLEAEFWYPVSATVAREARRARLPLIGFARVPWPDRIPLRSALRARRTLRSVAAVAAANQLAANPLEARRPGVPVRIVPPAGVTMPSTSVRPEEGQLTIGYVGRLLEWRGVDLLLRAAAKLGNEWRMLISGTGPAQVELEALAERLGNAARITWLGAQPRSRRSEFLEQLDVLVAPYRISTEAMELVGTPIMEAMAHGIPVIATRTGILPELIAESGLLVAPDSADSLAEALQAMAADAEHRHLIGAAGRRRAQQEFSHDAIARRTLELWREILPGG
jgi:glycosyltransferase involved in cell wall biosynthesis